jgi:nicotinate-nucleotide adenylyltransferase
VVPPSAGVDGEDEADRIGVFGGTFDPVHIGHLVAAIWAREALGLDRVFMVVANEPWQKSGVRRVTPAEDRLAVLSAAVTGVEGLEPSRLEIDRGGPSYTIDTIRELIDLHPGAALFLVVGADVAAELDSWHRGEELASLVRLVVVDRGGVDGSVDPPGWKVDHLRIPALDVSSSELRQRLAARQSVDFLIPGPAILCIDRLGLYAEGEMRDTTTGHR